MGYRARKLAEAPLMVVAETDDGEEWIPEHELAELLQFPNDDEEMADMLELLSLHLDRTGMALFVKDQDGGGRPSRMTLFAGDEFEVRPTEDRIYGEFELLAVKGPKKVRPPEEVVFLRFPHPRDRWRGLAPLDVLAKKLQLEAKLLRSTISGIENAVVPSLSIVFPREVPIAPDKMDEYSSKVTARFSNAKNSGKPFVTGQGARVTQHRLGFEGLASGDLYQEIEVAVCLVFGVRPEILAMLIGLENAPWSHMQTAQRLSYDETIIPLWRRVERAFTRQLLRPVDTDPSHLVRFDTSDVRALQADLKAEAERQKLLERIATRNQRRVIAGLEPEEDAPGEEPFWDEVEAAPAPTVNFNASGGPGDEPQPKKPPQGKALPTDARAVKWAMFDAERRGQQAVWAVSIEPLLEQDKAAVLAVFDGGKSGAPRYESKEAAEDAASRVKRAAERLAADQKKRWADVIPQLVRGTTRAAVGAVAQDLGISFEVLTPGLSKYVQREAAWLITQVVDTTKQAVRDALEQGLKEGEGVTELRDRIEELGAFKTSRAELIARTETTRVANGAQVDSLKEYQAESGNQVRKQWLATQDHRTRDEHRELDGEEVEIDGKFSNGLAAPGEPNCRCTIVFQLVED